MYRYVTTDEEHTKRVSAALEMHAWVINRAQPNAIYV